MYSKTFKVSWEEFHRDARALAWKLADVSNWDAIIAVTRGGLFPAGIIARELDIRLIDTVGVVSYDGKVSGDVSLIKEVSLAADGKVLLIDDLADTGRTFTFLKDHLPDAFCAALYTKPLGKDCLDMFVTEVSQETWISFPWEIEDDE